MKKNKKSFISILMANYNNEKYLSEAIESVINQSYKNWELIIIDDKSTDNSWQIIKKYVKKDKRIKAIKNKKNLGIFKTRNKFLKNINENCDYFAYMDSDDTIEPFKLEVQEKFLSKYLNYMAVGTGIIYCNERMKPIGERIYPITLKKIYKVMGIKSSFGEATMMFRKEVIDKVGYYDDTLEVAADYDYWFKILKKYKMTNISLSTYNYRQFPNQVKNKKLKKTIINTLKIKNRHMFCKKFFSFKALIRYFLEIGLLLLPNKLILWLFYKTQLK